MTTAPFINRPGLEIKSRLLDLDRSDAPTRGPLRLGELRGLRRNFEELRGLRRNFERMLGLRRDFIEL